MKERGSTATAVPASAVEVGFGATALASPPEELDGELKEAREHLLDLRRQQDELERRKGELEELRRKQDEYTRGRAELIDKLSRGRVTIEREQIQAQRLAELCEKTNEAFTDYQEQIESISDDDWTAEDLQPELSRALGVIENARLEYNRARTKLDCLNPNGEGAGAQETVAEPVDEQAELGRYLKLGAAASAPLILSVSIWAIVFLLVR